MFAKPAMVYKNGTLIVKDGEIVETVKGVTHTVKPEFDRAIEKPLQKYFNDYQTIAMSNFKISDDEMVECIGSATEEHPCNPS